MSRRRRLEPFDLTVLRLAKGGVGEGIAPDGKPMHVRGAPPGSVVHVVPMGHKKGVWQGRRTAMVSPAPASAEPRCAVFGLCGGCQLQELQIEAQRRHKSGLALRQASGEAGLEGIAVHDTRGADAAYGYRNKVELSFGPQRYLSEAEHQAGVPIDGRFLGMHAPGRFDRVVDTSRCELVGEAPNGLLAIVREHALADDAPVPWSVRSHTGFWRHLGLRMSEADREVLVSLYTNAPDEHATRVVTALAEALVAAELPDGWRCAGVSWFVNTGVADVARGELQQCWGRGHITEALLGKRFRLSPQAFFQTSTAGAEILYRTIGDALGEARGTLLDLYCGTGSIGITLAEGFERVVGVELVPEAVEDARANAAANGVIAEFEVGKVEDALDILARTRGTRSLVVDPPRAGLHPKVAKALATAEADVLVYVACNPQSLGRDRAALEEGGWRLTDLWCVDLFPHTGHMEVVGRFVRHVS
ncbi:MAG: 23S rRNA (uracil(1939)-C(5))-methyltransferase RlmD [Deltaproteobacteria bacterium]|nr:MAG: 23S rRNA (uracil(1939)-C(5))-methyltransferase RlmD [Deltaproteobacteria bacterium]